MRVLVVDDLETHRCLLRVLLEGHGHQVQEARDGAQALAMARQQPPDLIISDLLMPVMDGYMLLRDCRSDPALQRTPFIVYTATFTDDIDRQLALDLGANAVLVKPAEPEHLMQAVRQVMADALDAASSPPQQPALGDETADSAHSGALLRKLEGRSAQLQRQNLQHEQDLQRLAGLSAALDAHALVSITDAQGRITFVNPMFCQVSGYSRDELIGQNHRVVSSGLHPPAFFEDLWRTIARGGTWKGEICNRHKDGSLYWVDATLHPFLDDRGRPWQYAAIRTDITERKRAELARLEAEAHLRQAQKLDAIGTLAGGIAHGLNNVLGAILGHVSLAEEDSARGLPVQQNLAQIRSAAQRARTLVQGILSFSRQQPTTLVSQPLQPLVQEALDLLRGTLPAGVQLQAHLPADPLFAQVDGAQFEQVLLNLVTNAWHALPAERGRVDVGLERVSAPAMGSLTQGLAPGCYAHLWVRDDGVGMDGLTCSRAFDPFFTTKPVGKGSGLGLPTVYGIVQEHHGAVSLASAPGQGCTAHVLLPLAEAVALPPAGPAGRRAPARPGRGQRVLYIDDDETMTLLVEHLLRRAGYQPTVSRDPGEVLARLRSAPDAYDLVVTDYNMPRTSGLDLAHALRQLAPALPVVLTSGYIDSSLEQGCRRAGVLRLVHKERLAEDLVVTVQAVLSPGGFEAEDSNFGALPN